MIKTQYSHTLIPSSLFQNTKSTFFAYLLLLMVSTPLMAEKGFSDINNDLFDSPHMKNIKKAGKLNYVFTSNHGDKNINDTARIDVTNIRDNFRTDQKYFFFTKESNKPFSARTNMLGNGIFMLFLEWDIHDLERSTEGSWRHFQRRIRWAMAKNPTKEAIEIDYQGKKVKGFQYTIQPYADDKNSSRYGDYANKFYTFKFSDEIPGTIYQIRTITPKSKTWKEGDKVVSDAQLTFTNFIANTGEQDKNKQAAN